MMILHRISWHILNKVLLHISRLTVPVKSTQTSIISAFSPSHYLKPTNGCPCCCGGYLPRRRLYAVSMTANQLFLQNIIDIVKETKKMEQQFWDQTATA